MLQILHQEGISSATGKWELQFLQPTLPPQCNLPATCRSLEKLFFPLRDTFCVERSIRLDRNRIAC